MAEVSDDIEELKFRTPESKLNADFPWLNPGTDAQRLEVVETKAASLDSAADSGTFQESGDINIEAILHSDPAANNSDDFKMTDSRMVHVEMSLIEIEEHLHAMAVEFESRRSKAQMEITKIRDLLTSGSGLSKPTHKIVMPPRDPFTTSNIKLVLKVTAAVYGTILLVFLIVIFVFKDPEASHPFTALQQSLRSRTDEALTPSTTLGTFILRTPIPFFTSQQCFPPPLEISEPSATLQALISKASRQSTTLQPPSFPPLESKDLEPSTTLKAFILKESSPSTTLQPPLSPSLEDPEPSTTLHALILEVSSVFTRAATQTSSPTLKVSASSPVILRRPSVVTDEFEVFLTQESRTFTLEPSNACSTLRGSSTFTSEVSNSATLQQSPAPTDEVSKSSVTLQQSLTFILETSMTQQESAPLVMPQRRSRRFQWKWKRRRFTSYFGA